MKDSSTWGKPTLEFNKSLKLWVIRSSTGQAFVLLKLADKELLKACPGAIEKLIQTEKNGK